MKIIGNRKENLSFIADAITNRSDIFVRFGPSQGIEDQKKLSNFVKLGRISGETIRGWIRNAMEHLLLEHGISICHPLPENTITADRNKEAYKKDLKLGYHPRNECKEDGGCLILKLFGDLNLPGNLMVRHVYFYPTSNGGTITKNHQKIFRNVGTGRLELTKSSPRVRHNGYQPYMTSEITTGSMIEAPFQLILHEDDEDQYAVLMRTLEFLFEKINNDEFKYLLGGKRNCGYGRAVAVFLNESGNYITKGRNNLGQKKEEAEIIQEKFKDIVKEEKKKFPIGYTPKKSKEGLKKIEY